MNRPKQRTCQNPGPFLDPPKTQNFSQKPKALSVSPHAVVNASTVVLSVTPDRQTDGLTTISEASTIAPSGQKSTRHLDIAIPLGIPGVPTHFYIELSFHHYTC